MSDTKKTKEEKTIILPTQKVKALTQNPKNLIIFSKPKVGKTELLSQLDNCLIIDCEEGSDYVDAIKYKVNSVQEIKELGKEIIKQGKPYTYIALDTVTALENMCVNYAELLYSKKTIGKNWFKKDTNGKLSPESGKAQYGNILNLPNGAGYSFLREAMTSVIDYVKTLAPYIILVGHIKDVQLEKKGAEFTSQDLDLTGKIKRILSSQSDAIGYLYRKGNQNILSFATTDEVSCGARSSHLRNKEIVISEMTDKGLITHWDKVYINN
jgi:hypothetical protein